MSFLNLSSVTEEPLALTLSNDEGVFELGERAIEELNDVIFEPLCTSTPCKRKRDANKNDSHSSFHSTRAEEPLWPENDVPWQEDETSSGE